MAAIYSDDMILGVLQARVSSTRFPGKVLKPILGVPMLAHEIERIERSLMIEHLVVATSRETQDDAIAELCRERGIVCSRGSLTDVLDRFYRAAKPYAPQYVVRLTGDCPLIDPEVIDATIRFTLHGDYDYASNCQAPYTFPDGLDTEVVRFSALEEAAQEAVLPSHREHVTPFVRKQPDRYRVGHYQREVSLGHLRWTVDEPEDLIVVTNIYEALYPSLPTFTTQDILPLLERNASWLDINGHIGRNEGSKKSEREDAMASAQAR